MGSKILCKTGKNNGGGDTETRKAEYKCFGFLTREPQQNRMREKLKDAVAIRERRVSSYSRITRNRSKKLKKDKKTEKETTKLKREKLGGGGCPSVYTLHFITSPFLFLIDFCKIKNACVFFLSLSS